MPPEGVSGRKKLIIPSVPSIPSAVDVSSARFITTSLRSFCTPCIHGSPLVPPTPVVAHGRADEHHRYS
eukprot:g3334.t1